MTIDELEAIFNEHIMPRRSEGQVFMVMMGTPRPDGNMTPESVSNIHESDALNFIKSFAKSQQEFLERSN